MPALSFQEEWINKLLRGDKQQTTRPQTDRIKVGDIVHIYNQQRRRITDKPMRMLTASGIEAMHERGYPFVPEFLNAHYHAHLLGKVEISEVFDITPSEMSGAERNEWAIADGFNGFHPWSSISSNGIQQDIGANMWFLDRYGDGWMTQTWTVIRWDGWLERYFEPEE